MTLADPRRPSNEVEQLGDRTPRVEISAASRHTTIVALCGEYDLSTNEFLVEAMGGAGGAQNILVDLTDCAFIDSTTIGVLFRAYSAGLLNGQRVELIAPDDDGFVRRTLRIAAVDQLLPIHESRERALNAVEATTGSKTRL